MKASIIAPVLLAGLAAASPVVTPTKTLQERDTTLCGQWDNAATGAYTLYNNLWGTKYANAGGSQCTTLKGLSGNSLSWSTTWTWAGEPTHVKTYPNAVTSFTPRQLSAVNNIPSTWSWSYHGTSVVANVAYDLFTAPSTTADLEYEIMIWLDALGGAGPISSTGQVIATPNIGGTSYKLYKGVNGALTVFSFVSTTVQTNYNGDLNNFIKYLTGNQGLPSNQYLRSIGAGSESFTGTGAVFSTSAYTLAVN